MKANCTFFSKVKKLISKSSLYKSIYSLQCNPNIIKFLNQNMRIHSINYLDKEQSDLKEHVKHF